MSGYLVIDACNHVGTVLLSQVNGNATLRNMRTLAE